LEKNKSLNHQITKSPLLQPDHPVRQRFHERGQDSHHAGEKYENGQEHRDDFRHEHQRNLLDLRQRLQKRDNQADRQPDEHNRRAQLQGDHDRFTDEFDDFGLVHESRLTEKRKKSCFLQILPNAKLSTVEL
jgi:hypothetical protein